MTKLSGSDFWVIVDECFVTRWYGASFTQELHSIKLHDDRDDPDHTFLNPTSWSLFPNAKNLAKWYNAPHTRSIRMLFERATSYSENLATIMDNAYLAKEALYLQKEITKNPFAEHHTSQLDWSPSRWVWKKRTRWVKTLETMK
jgi:hypothetical protein